MTPFSANPFIYLFSVIAIAAVLLYFGYAGIDRIGLEVQTTVGTVTGKQLTPKGTSYTTNIAGGRAWTQSQETPETYAVMLTVDEEKTVGLVTKPLFDALNANDRVNVKIRRTRITRRLEVVEVTR